MKLFSFEDVWVELERLKRRLRQIEAQLKKMALRRAEQTKAEE